MFSSIYNLGRKTVVFFSRLGNCALFASTTLACLTTVVCVEIWADSRQRDRAAAMQNLSDAAEYDRYYGQRNAEAVNFQAPAFQTLDGLPAASQKSFEMLRDQLSLLENNHRRAHSRTLEDKDYIIRELGNLEIRIARLEENVREQAESSIFREVELIRQALASRGIVIVDFAAVEREVREITRDSRLVVRNLLESYGLAAAIGSEARGQLIVDGVHNVVDVLDGRLASGIKPYAETSGRPEAVTKLPAVD